MLYTRKIADIIRADERLDSLADTFTNTRQIIKLARGLRGTGRPTNEVDEAWDGALEDSCNKLNTIADECTALIKMLRCE